MKRKTAVCKCGRAVELQMEYTGQYPPYDRIYQMVCPCGQSTDSHYNPYTVRAEWKRLQEANDGK